MPRGCQGARRWSSRRICGTLRVMSRARSGWWLALASALALGACSSPAPAACDGGTCGDEPLAAGATYRDENPARGTSGGTVHVARAADESAVDEYAAFWVDGADGRLGVAARGPKTGADLDLVIASGPVPATATGVVVVTARAGTDALRGVLAGEADNYPRLVDLGASGPAATAPRVVPGADRMLVVATAAADMEHVLLYSCAPDAASACTVTTVNGPPQCGRSPTGTVDGAAGRLLIVAAHGGAANRATMLGCATDGTDCSLADLSAGQGSDSGLHPQALLDPGAGKLLVVARNDAAGAKPWLYRCNSNGSGCTSRDVSASLGAFPADASARPSAALGPDSLWVAWPTAAGVGLVRCGADGSGCTGVDLVQKASLGSATAPSVAFDATGAQVLVAVETGGAVKLVRCAADLATCTRADISPMLGAPALALDEGAGKLWVAGTNAGGAVVVRCERDGSACAPMALSPSSPASRASLGLDGNRAWIAFDDGAPTHLAVWAIGLW